MQAGSQLSVRVRRPADRGPVRQRRQDACRDRDRRRARQATGLHGPSKQRFQTGLERCVELRQPLAQFVVGQVESQLCQMVGGERGVLKELAAEIEEDRQSLMDAMDRLDVPKHSAKMAAGWLGEKIGRLKPNGSLLHRTALTPVVVIGRAPGVSDAVPRPSPADAPPRCPGR